MKSITVDDIESIVCRRGIPYNDILSAMGGRHEIPLLEIVAVNVLDWDDKIDELLQKGGLPDPTMAALACNFAEFILKAVKGETLHFSALAGCLEIARRYLECKAKKEVVLFNIDIAENVASSYCKISNHYETAMEYTAFTVSRALEACMNSNLPGLTMGAAMNSHTAYYHILEAFPPPDGTNKILDFEQWALNMVAETVEERGR